MTMTSASKEYFSTVAGDWDNLRQGYFTEAVRKTAIRVAHLHPEMVVADIGAGTGFMTAGLAPLVRQVYLLDGSPEMLAIARQNLQEYNNLVFQQADGGALPLPDNSVDSIFANMYLHHLPDPLAGIREMVRLLKPGGRLVLTDLDSHPYTWLKVEKADLWQGFERAQMLDWFEQAGLVNRILNSTGESCHDRSSVEETDAEAHDIQISIFVAVGAKPVPGVEATVSEHYGAIAEGERCGCASTNQDSTSCCSPDDLISLDMVTLESTAVDQLIETGYSDVERESVPAEAAEISLGCGNPSALAGMQPGEVVLDIGSGGGIDAFLSARTVGPTGRVIGVDMTPAMLERARNTAAASGFTNVEFRQGQADALPAEDNSVDVIISNCVINLTRDKGQVFKEAYRVLRKDGRLEVSDIVTDRSFPSDWIQHGEGWSSCVTGALPEEEYVDLVKQAGFSQVQVRRSQSANTGGVKVFSAQVSARK